MAKCVEICISQVGPLTVMSDGGQPFVPAGRPRRWQERTSLCCRSCRARSAVFFFSFENEDDSASTAAGSMANRWLWKPAARFVAATPTHTSSSSETARRWLHNLILVASSGTHTQSIGIYRYIYFYLVLYFWWGGRNCLAYFRWKMYRADLLTIYRLTGIKDFSRIVRTVFWPRRYVTLSQCIR